MVRLLERFTQERIDFQFVLEDRVVSRKGEFLDTDDDKLSFRTPIDYGDGPSLPDAMVLEIKTDFLTILGKHKKSFEENCISTILICKAAHYVEHNVVVLPFKCETFPFHERDCIFRIDAEVTHKNSVTPLVREYQGKAVGKAEENPKIPKSWVDNVKVELEKLWNSDGTMRSLEDSKLIKVLGVSLLKYAKSPCPVEELDADDLEVTQ